MVIASRIALAFLAVLALACSAASPGGGSRQWVGDAESPTQAGASGQNETVRGYAIYDGCNTCTYGPGGLGSCTLVACYSYELSPPDLPMCDETDEVPCLKWVEPPREPKSPDGAWVEELLRRERAADLTPVELEELQRESDAWFAQEPPKR